MTRCMTTPRLLPSVGVDNFGKERPGPSLNHYISINPAPEERSGGNGMFGPFFSGPTRQRNGPKVSKYSQGMGRNNVFRRYESGSYSHIVTTSSNPWLSIRANSAL